MKPLEALKRIRQETCPATILPDFDKEECCNIIENALKRLEEHDKIFKKYDIDDNWLEATLYVIKKHFPTNTETQLDKLQALEVIISKPYDIDWVIDIIKSGCEYETYLYLVDCSDNKLLQKFKYTREEYKVLRKVLLKVLK